MKTFLEQISLWTAIIASCLIALHLPFSGWAFIFYIVSNVTSLYVLRKSDAPKVISYQMIFFFAINLLGVYQWLLVDHPVKEVCTPTVKVEQIK
jgi:uncharacterized membrane protein